MMLGANIRYRKNPFWGESFRFPRPFLRLKRAMIYVCGEANQGRIDLVEEILNHRIIGNALRSGPSSLVVVIESSREDDTLGSGAYDLLNRRFVVQMKNVRIASYSAGMNHELCIDGNGGLYSWGRGEWGELGLGYRRKEATEPLKITYNAAFTSIYVGDVHSCALDEHGNAYGWGQNRSRQLGLYTKAKKDMKNPHCQVEDFIFSPRFLPFSLKNPVKSISCGPHFSIAVTKSGELWSWGAGDCGQLGGDTNFKEAPSKVDFSISNCKIIDASAGYAHVLALASDGEVFAWGLNLKFQLGIGNRSIKSTNTPTKLSFHSVGDELELVKMKRVVASLHSSAAISEQGHLYTWGSNSYGKLLHPFKTHDNVDVPTRVTKFTSRVHDFAYSAKNSAVLILSKLDSVSPNKGPIKSFSSLTLHGCGFWNSSNCIVQFTLLSTERNPEDEGLAASYPPRTCSGIVSHDREVTCSPPRLPTTGVYEVAITFNGVDYLTDTCQITVYQNPSVADLEPKRIRGLDEDFVDVELTLKKSLPGNQLYVKFILIPFSTPVVEVERTLVVEKKQDGDKLEDTKFAHRLDLKIFGSLPHGFLIKAAVSLNSQDFSKVSTEAIICDSSSPQSISSNCFPSIEREEDCPIITIYGMGFPPTDIVPSYISLKLAHSSINDNLNDSLLIPAAADSTSEMSFRVPTRNMLRRITGMIVDDPAIIEMDLRIVVNNVMTDASPLFRLVMYESRPVIVNSSVYRRHGDSILVITSGSMLFPAISPKIRLSAPEIGLIKIVDATITPVASTEIMSSEDAEEMPRAPEAYEILFPCPSLYADTNLDANVGEVESTEDMIEATVDTASFIMLALMLNGVSIPPEDHQRKLILFNGLKSISWRNGSKAGVPHSTSVVFSAQGLIHSDNCVVKIIGADESAAITFPGVINLEDASVTSMLPEEAANLAGAENKSKAKTFYVAISVDGGVSFDKSDSAILYVKV